MKRGKRDFLNELVFCGKHDFTPFLPKKETPKEVLNLAIAIGGDAAPYVGDIDGIPYFQVFKRDIDVPQIAYPLYGRIYITYKDGRPVYFKPYANISWEDWCKAHDLPIIKN